MSQILFFAYLAFSILIFYTQDLLLLNSYFVWVVTPLALIPVKISKINFMCWPLEFSVRLSFENTFNTLRMAYSQIFLALSIFIFAISLSTWMAPYPTAGWFWLFASFAFATICFLLITARLSVEIESFYIKYFCMMSAVVAINALCNELNFFQSLPDFRTFSAHRMDKTLWPVPAAGATAMAFTYGFYCLTSIISSIEVRSRAWRLISGFSAAILFSVVVLTQSRGALGALLISVFLYLSFNFGINWKKLVVFCSALIAAVSVFFTIFPSYLSRSMGGRDEVWASFLSLILERPVFGYGERIEFWVKNTYGDHLGHAHNLLLSSALRGGIVACVSLFAAFALSFYFISKLAKKKKSYLPLCVMVMLALAGLVDYDLLVMPANWQWMTIWLGLSFCCAAEISDRSQRIMICRFSKC